MAEGFALMYAAIALSGGKGFALVSAADAHLRQRSWYLHTNGYVRNDSVVRGKRLRTYLHRAVAQNAGAPPPRIDHINGNPLDNRRENLRGCTHTENVQNRTVKRTGSSRFKGVQRKRNGKWLAQITVAKRRVCLGTFDTEEAAQDAYAAASLKYFGAFAAPRVEKR